MPTCCDLASRGEAWSSQITGRTAWRAGFGAMPPCGAYHWCCCSRLVLMAMLLVQALWAHAPAVEPCTCAGFCAGTCSFTAGGRPALADTSSESWRRNLTLYRFSPPGQSSPGSLADRNTGDASGDLEFLLDRRALSARCAIEPTNERCFLAPWRHVPFGRWRVELDARFGPYMSCIPRYTNANYSAWNVSDFACTQDCNTPTMPGVSNQSDGRCALTHENSSASKSDGQRTCFCPRAERTVGRLARDAPQPSQVPRWCTYAGLSPLPMERGCLTGLMVNTTPSFLPLSLPVDDEALGACCAACDATPGCHGYNVRLRPGAVGNGPTRCELFAQASLAPARSVECQGVVHSSLSNPPDAAPTSARLPGGAGSAGWFWGVALDPPGAWYSTPSLGECRQHLGRPPIDGTCSWRQLGESVQVASECVLERIDAALMRSPAMQRCLTAFNCSRHGPPVGGEASGAVKESDCFLRCSYAIVGGGRRAALISSSVLLAAFEGAFNEPSTGGCERLI